MMTTIQLKQATFTYRVFSAFIAFTFVFSSIIPPQRAQAKNTLNLPIPGAVVPVTQSFSPLIIKGVNINPENPLQFNFIVDMGDTDFKEEVFNQKVQKLIKYFLASLTIPENEMWVNLSPYEKDRIVPDSFGQTEMGRDLLAQDYMLKQLTASLMYPEENLGKEFWDRVYKKAQKQFGTTEIPINTFNKIWIVPEKADVYEHSKGAYVVDSYLKVMLEEDYLALEHHQRSGQLSVVSGQNNGLSIEHRALNTDITSGVSAEIVRELLIPEIEREVNEGKTFSQLRQIYHSMILATWYKQNLKQSLLGNIYVNQKKTNGLEVRDKKINQKIYAQYIEAYKKGVYDFIKEEYDSETQQIIPRKYFSGGVGLGKGAQKLRRVAASSPVLDRGKLVTVNLSSSPISNTNPRIHGLRSDDPEVVKRAARRLVHAAEQKSVQHALLHRHILSPSKDLLPQYGHATVASGALAMKLENLNAIAQTQGLHYSELPIDKKDQFRETELFVEMEDGRLALLDLVADTLTSKSKIMQRHMARKVDGRAQGESIHHTEHFTDDIEEAFREIAKVAYFIDPATGAATGDKHSGLIRISREVEDGANGTRIFFVFEILSNGQRVLRELVQRPRPQWKTKVEASSQWNYFPGSQNMIINDATGEIALREGNYFMIDTAPKLVNGRAVDFSNWQYVGSSKYMIYNQKTGETRTRNRDGRFAKDETTQGHPTVTSVILGHTRGDQLATGQLFNLIKKGGAVAEDIRKRLNTIKGKKKVEVTAFTGAAGIGKSSAVDALTSSRLQKKRRKGKNQIAIIGIDPSGQRGVLLGDRLRLKPETVVDDNMYYLSVPVGDGQGGIAQNTDLMVKVFEIFGMETGEQFDEVIIETVGVGQTDTDVSDLVRKLGGTVVALVSPGMDRNTFLKDSYANAEFADVLLVTRADLNREEAEATAKMAREVFAERRRSDDSWTPPVIETAALKHTVEGIDEVSRQIDLHKAHLKTNPRPERQSLTVIPQPKGKVLVLEFDQNDDTWKTAGKLRDEGFEVLYVKYHNKKKDLGMLKNIAQAAIDEDVAAIYVEVKPEDEKLAKEIIGDLKGRSIPVIARPTTTSVQLASSELTQDSYYRLLENQAGIPEIRNVILEHVQDREPLTADQIKERLKEIKPGDRRQAAQLMSQVENTSPAVLNQLSSSGELDVDALVVGINGPPGAGKSTLIGKISEFRKAGLSVGLIMNDPSSDKSGGAMLIDYNRMQDEFALDDDVIIRSTGTRGASGTALSNEAIAKIMDNLGVDIIIIESEGTSQTFQFTKVHTNILIQAPENVGDAQPAKSGSIQKAHLVVMTKSDQGGATPALAALKAGVKMHPSQDGWEKRVIATSARTGEGFHDLIQALAAHADHLNSREAAASSPVSSKRSRVAEQLRSVKRDSVKPDPSAAEATMSPDEVEDLWNRLYAAKEPITILLKDLKKKQKALAAARRKFDKLDTQYKSFPRPLTEEHANMAHELSDARAEVQDAETGLKMQKILATGTNAGRLRAQLQAVQKELMIWQVSNDQLDFSRLNEHEQKLVETVTKSLHPGYRPDMDHPGRRPKYWTPRQYTGFNSAEDSNDRYLEMRYAEGRKAFSVAFDVLTQTNRDSEEGLFNIGEEGVPISTIEDMEVLLRGIDRFDPGVSVSMTINAGAAQMEAFFMGSAARQLLDEAKWKESMQFGLDWYERWLRANLTGTGEEIDREIKERLGKEITNWTKNRERAIAWIKKSRRGADEAQENPITEDEAIEYVFKNLRGTLQNDFHKEEQVRRNTDFDSEAQARFTRDILEENAGGKFSSISSSGYHYGEAGASAEQELAFQMLGLIEHGTDLFTRQRDGGNATVNNFIPQLSGFYDLKVGGEAEESPQDSFLGQVAKLRAARAIFAKIALGYFGATTDDLKKYGLRFHSQTSGLYLSSASELEEMLNVPRIMFEMLSGFYGGTQTMHADSHDEARQLPSQAAARIARRMHDELREALGDDLTVDPVSSGDTEMVKRHVMAVAEAAYNLILEEWDVFTNEPKTQERMNVLRKAIDTEVVRKLGSLDNAAQRLDQLTKKTEQRAWNIINHLRRVRRKSGHEAVNQAVRDMIQAERVQTKNRYDALQEGAEQKKRQRPKVLSKQPGQISNEDITEGELRRRMAPYTERRRKRLATLERFRSRRDSQASQQAADNVVKAYIDDRNIVLPMTKAAMANATLGEMSKPIRNIAGEYQQTVFPAPESRIEMVPEIKSDTRLKYVVGIAGYGGHDAGYSMVVATMVNAGMEVVALGARQTPEMFVRAAIQEGAHIGISTLSGANVHFVAELMKLLRQADPQGTIKVVMGGIIGKDREALKKLGVLETFDVSFGNASPSQIVQFFQEQADAAASSPIGGIDLNPTILNMNVSRDREGIQFNVPQESLPINTNGFIPVIINVTPINSLKPLLGLSEIKATDTSTNVQFM